MLKLRIQTILTVVAALIVLSFLIYGTCCSGYATEAQIERVMEEAETVSKDFSLVLSFDSIERTSVKHDPFFEEEVKIIDFRVSPLEVLRVRYNSENKIVFTEIILTMSVPRSFAWLSVLIYAFGATFFCIYQVSDLKEAERLNKSNKKEIVAEN